MTKGDALEKRYVVFDPTEKLRCTHTHITLADAKHCELFVTRKRAMLLHVPKEWLSTEVDKLLVGFQKGSWTRITAASSRKKP